MPLIYTYVDVKEELVQALRIALAEEGYESIRVLKSDPREAAEIPCICVNRTNADETSQVLADEVDERFDEATQTWYDYKGTFFNETMEIRVWHSNADERDKLYVLTKAVLFNMRTNLVEKGLRNVKLQGGRDEQDNTFPPHVLYWSSINMNYLNPLEVEVEVGAPITAVDVISTLEGGDG